MATNQQNFRVRNGLTIDGATTGSSSFANPTTGSDVSFTLPGVYPASNGYVLASTTAGVLSWVDNSAAGTTYTIDASVATGGANLNLQGSDSTTDTIKFAGGTNVTITATDANTITIDAPDTNTTYDFNATSATGGANLNLVGSDATTDSVKLSDGGHITATYTSATEVTLGSDATDANTASTIVARDASGDFSASGATLGNITIAVVDDNTISTTSGNLTLDSTGGNIILNSNGTLGMTLAPIAGFNPNADFTGNIVKGVIRTGAGEATGDIWQLFGPAGQATGISIDNTDKPADRTNLVIRNYGASLTGGVPRLGIIGESARGTAAVPLNLNSGNVLIDIFGNGYTNLGWATDLVATTPAIIRLQTTEAWTNGLNNTGTGLLVLTQPTATTLSAASLQSTIVANPQIFNCRSDAYSWSNGKSGTSQKMTLNSSGNLIVSAGSITANGAFNQESVMNANVILLDTNTTAGGTFGITTLYKPSSVSATYTIPLVNNRLGGYKINGDDSTTGTSSVLASQLSTKATENWATGTANGTAIELLANKKGVGWLTGHRVVASFSPDDSYVDATYININNPITSSTYNNVSNLRFNAGNPAGATFNDRTSQLRVTTASTSSGDASTIVFNTGNYNTGTGNFSASVAADTLGEFFFGGNYGTGSNFTTLGPSVRFAAKAAETFTGTNSGGRFVVSIDKIGGNVQYDAITVDSANASIASDIITLESNTGTDYAVLNSTSATFAQPVGFPVKTAAQWNAITGAAGRQVSVSDSAGGSHPNGMMAFWDTSNARWSYIHDNSAV
jgi:hypothetical protein